MIAAGKLVPRDPIPVRTVHHRQPGLLAQFECDENRANMANDGRANVGCVHLTSPMVRVCKPQPIGCTPIAPWNLRCHYQVSVNSRSPSFSIEVAILSPALSHTCLSFG